MSQNTFFAFIALVVLGVGFFFLLQEAPPEENSMLPAPQTPEINPPPQTGGGGETVSNGCYRGGCSGQLCSDKAGSEGLATTCEWREEYACYRTARCERQINGKCGWTQTTELTSCVDAAL